MRHDQRPVAFFDSGVGGLPYLAAARALVPTERYVYLADRAGFPYGTKSREAVTALALASIAALVRHSRPKAIVVACNTATELAIDAIRTANPLIPVIGTVPAIKPAAALSKLRRIGVVATPGAAAAGYLTDLASEWASGCEVIKRGDGALVDFVERKFIGSSHEERLAAVQPSVRAMLDSGVDAIVLGCTHFLHLAAEFAEAAGPGVAIVDSREGIANRLRDVLGAGADDAGSGTGPRNDQMFLTGVGPFGAVYSGFASLYDLRQGGCLS